MSVNWFMGLALVFTLGHIFANLLSGTYVGASEVDAVNTLSSFGINEIREGGVFGIPSATFTFFTQGVPLLITWNYPGLFDGNWFLLQLMLISISIGVVWGIVQVFGSSAASIVGGILGRP